MLGAKKYLTQGSNIAQHVLLIENQYRNMSDNELKQQTHILKQRLSGGEPFNDLIHEALAIAREASFRAHGIYAYKVQMIGTYIIHTGNFAEMRTGEGKTLVIAMAAFLSVLEAGNVHVITVNEYLVKRDAEFCRKILNFLGLSVGFNSTKLSREMKQSMFQCDVTYTTNSELGFDYLRDNMIYQHSQKIIPCMKHAIVDEGDSVLIDEAQTPLIISGYPAEDDFHFIEIDQVIKTLLEIDYTIDFNTRTISLNNSGINKVEEALSLKNLYALQNSEVVSKINNALLANFLFSNGKEYIVKDNKIVLIDPHTGRQLPGQSYNAGLQQSLQAKEYLGIEPENKIMATTTYQTLFRLYDRLSALSGTADTEKEELKDCYNLMVIKIPTNKPIIRKDLPDIIFGTKKSKMLSIMDEIKKHFILGQPVLVGTTSVTDSEFIHDALIKENIPSDVLNAKNHEKESIIISKAGRKHAITIATNIAGRGVDIKINDEVRALGGLYVLGTERNDDRRIDNQLRGRSGRQGDPGKSLFLISLEDNIFKKFGADKFEKLAQKVDNEVFDSFLFSRALANIQRKIKNLGFDNRKNLIEYTEILSKQQSLFYKQRESVTLIKGNVDLLKRMVYSVSKNLVKDSLTMYAEITTINLEKLNQNLNELLKVQNLNFFKGTNPQERDEIEKITTILLMKSLHDFINYSKNFIDDIENKLKNQLLTNLDVCWQRHLETSEKLRSSTSLASFEQKSPLNVFIEKIEKSFREELANTALTTLKELFNIETHITRQESLKELIIPMKQKIKTLETFLKNKRIKEGLNSLLNKKTRWQDTPEKSQQHKI